MTEPDDEPSDLSPLMREALAWVVRLRSGSATKADVNDVTLWRARSPEHEAAFRQAVNLWRDLQAAGNKTAAFDHEGHLRGAGAGLSRRALIGGAIAASAAGYLVYRPPLDLWPSLPELQADYRTAKGERREINVAEGVAVTLNTFSSLSILSSDIHRPEIELLKGEASIKAARSADRPLVVQVLDLKIQASSAAFTARCVDGKVSVTCLEGTVDVENGARMVALDAGLEVAFLEDEGLGTPLAVDPEQAAAWQRGLLIFHSKPLREVVAEVNRYRPGKIIVTDDRLGNRLVNGTFHLDRLDLFPGQVQQLFGASLRSFPGGIVFLS